MEVSVQTTSNKQTTGPEPSHVGPTLSRAHFNSASSLRGLARDNSLDVITEEQEVLITQLPEEDFQDPPPFSAPPKLSQEPEEEVGSEEVPPEGVFVQVGDVEQFIEDCDTHQTPPTPTHPTPRRKKGPRAVSPLPIKVAVSSDDEDYETDLEYDEEVWLNPDKHDHDVTGKTKYIKVCSDFGVTPVTSFLESLHEREINLKFYGLSVTSAKALSVPLETNTITEKLNLEGNGIEKEATKFLCRILKENLYITELVLRDNQIGREGAVAVCDLMLQNRCITKLDLSGNQIEDSCAPLFAKVLTQSNSSLKQLKLAHNRFEDSGARHFQEAISDNESLELLDLSWNHFGCAGSALLAQGLQENVGLKYFYMPMAGVGSSGCALVSDVLKANRTLLELDLSYCRIPVSGLPDIATGLRENDTLQVFKVGSNPFDADCAMMLLKGVEENDSCALKHLDLASIFVKAEFVALAAKLQEQRGMTVHYEGVLPAPPKYQRSVAEMVQFRTDPVGHLKTCLTQASASPSEVFHLNGPAKITKQDFTDTVRMAQLDLTAEQINILFAKVQVNGLIDIEHLLDLLENPLPAVDDD
ncbi:uncharacterized protein LOC143281199 [Babylonia areolata]|uniref:uncharacterized protein LOC143281199 n=1 Tax=Babylonia areolata TaxID=304850 RepID=UPI003FD07A4A